MGCATGLHMVTTCLGIVVLLTVLLQAAVAPDIYGAVQVPDSEGGNGGGIVTHHSEAAEIGETPGDTAQLVRLRASLYPYLCL